MYKKSSLYIDINILRKYRRYCVFNFFIITKCVFSIY